MRLSNYAGRCSNWISLKKEQLLRVWSIHGHNMLSQDLNHYMIWYCPVWRWPKIPSAFHASKTVFGWVSCEILPIFSSQNRTILICSRITNCLVVTVTMEFYDFPFSWEFHHHWRTHSIIFQVGVGWNHQPAKIFLHISPYFPKESQK